jgi:hypothetical protein
VIVLVSGGHPRHRGEHIGRLQLPRSADSPRDGEIWAADNGAYSGFDETAFLRMLDRLEPWRDTCLFVACPDVVGSHSLTLDLFDLWAPRLQKWPLALVAQNGLTPEAVPWWRIDALFIGGTTEFKLSPKAAALVREAKQREKWVHMGRVNTIRRMVYANSIGVDSIDGTSFSRWSDIYIPRAVRILPHRQLALEEQ